MILHDFRCACGKTFERMVDWKVEHVGCSCGGTAQRVFLPRHRNAQSFDPVLVYRDAAGHYRFPGRNSGPVPKGYEPVYLRTTESVRKFEREMNAKERERYFAHKERAEAAFDAPLREGRAALREKMRRMSAGGREFAEAAMKANNQSSNVDVRFDPGFHLPVFSFDASNREEQYDRDLPRRK